MNFNKGELNLSLKNLLEFFKTQEYIFKALLSSESMIFISSKKNINLI